MYRHGKASQFAVLGLGRFGQSIVQALSEFDVNILACDKDPNKLNEVKDYATHLIQADISDENAVKKLGLGNFEVVILATGADFESAQIASMIAKEQGAKYVMVKARNFRQKKILEKIGVDKVVLPEHEMGMRIAKSLMGTNILEVLDDCEHYTIAEMTPLDEWIGKSIKEADVRRKHNITVLAVIHDGDITIPVCPERILGEKDVLVTISKKSTTKKP